MDYKAYALMAILLASVASVALAGAAYAQSTITVKTDKPSYATGDEVTVTGKLTATTINQPLLIRVKDPEGNFDKIDQFEAAADGSYTYKFRTGGTMNTNGAYTVIISYKGTTTEETTFQFDAGMVWKKFNIRVGDKTYPVEYQITGGSVTNMVPEEKTMTLTVTISSTANGNLQIRLPRNVIDAREGPDGRSGADEDFVVFADEVPSDVSNETETTVDRRTLTIDFEQGTETIEIVGTWAIPEFGAIAAIILAIAIVGIIVATARYGKFNFAPRL
ncbi:MAG TPA: PEFG-CTERM sorting domain-containing protein [Nitrososphaera sp.]|jgi:predicted secreted protein with PEFG-CTERM motif|nr:PEFG-CTERM sorting domain-containing protein [Nitrososphaera sp.]